MRHAFLLLPPINSVTNQRKETNSQIKATQTKMDALPKELPHPSQDQALPIISDIHNTLHRGPKALFHSLEPFFDPTNPQTHNFTDSLFWPEMAWESRRTPKNLGGPWKGKSFCHSPQGSMRLGGKNELAPRAWENHVLLSLGGLKVPTHIKDTTAPQ